MLLMIALCTITAISAQQPTKMPLVAGDTVVNTGSVTKAFTVTAGYSTLGVQANLVKISGTVAGKVYLQSCLDNSHFTTTDSVTVTDIAVNTIRFSKPAPSDTYYRVVATGSGTMSAVLTVYYVPKKYQTP